MRWRLYRGFDESMWRYLRTCTWMTESEAGLDGIVRAVEERSYPRESLVLQEYRDSRIDDYSMYWTSVFGENKAIPMGVDYIEEYIKSNSLEDDFARFKSENPFAGILALDGAGFLDYIVETNVLPVLESMHSQCLCVYRDFDRHGILVTK